MQQEFEYDLSRQQKQKLSSGKLHQLVQAMLGRILEAGIPYIIHLHHTNILNETIKSATETKKVVADFKTIYQFIKEIFQDFFTQISPQTHDLFKKLLDQEQYKKIDEKKIWESWNEQQVNINKKWKGVFKEYFELKNTFLIHKFNEVVEQKIINFEFESNKTAELRVLPYLCMNWIKREFDNLRESKGNQKQICCRLFFADKMKIEAVEGKNVQFKRYYWPITSSNIHFHLRKTIVGFLNTSGGIIYIGVQENKQKLTNVSCMELKDSEKGELIKYFRDTILEDIFPKHKGFEITKQNITVHNYKRIPLNDYVSMEILPVADEQSLLPLPNKYIVKIFVKIGHPKHLYYLIAHENMIDFFIREDRNVEKKPFPDAYNMIYEKLDAFQKYKKTKNQDRLPKRNLFHFDCRYDMKVELDIDPDSDEDSD